MQFDAKAKDIFAQAIECPASARAAFVHGACGGDADLEHRVQGLLQAHDQVGEFLANPTLEGDDRPGEAAGGSGPVAAPTEQGRNGEAAVEGPGTTIGPYKLLQEIGSGGFGVVYMAQQQHPVRRQVALKIIKLGMDTRQVIARFEAERQALAMMEHSNIARVLDAGATETGRPYFVMELVRGISITEYCDKNSLSTVERIRLFTRVCRAVQHAHQKGIIHRDIKPNNVLVTLHDGRPVPKVIDFGIAKAIHQRLTEKTLFTEFRQFIGTPQYMSPEQAEMSGLDIDTRSDIYSLGVLLYELLTGTTPFDPHEMRVAPLPEIQRMIRESAPARPSTRVSTIGDELDRVANNRGTDPDRLSRILRGDLDWIVMKALEKDRTRRYESASELAEDLRRYLRREPVVAGPPSTLYRVRKLVERHRGAVYTAVAMALVLIFGIVGTSTMAVSALEQRDRAERQARIAELTNGFLNQELLAQADPINEPDRDIALRTVVDRAAQRIDGRFEQEPLVEAAIRSTIGSTYIGLGEYAGAEHQFVHAHRLRQTVLGPDDPETMRSSTDLARLCWRAGRHDEAEAIAAPLLERQTAILGDDHADTLDTMDTLALALKGATRYEDAEPLLDHVLEARTRTLGAEHPATLSSMNNLGTLYKHQGRYEKSAAIHRRALEIRLRVLGEEHPHTLTSMSNLALSCQLLGRYEETEPLSRRVVEVRTRVLGATHPQTLGALNNLGYVLSRQDRFREALPYYEQVLETRRRLLGDDHPDTLLSMNNLGWALTGLGLLDEAEPVLLEMLERTGRAQGKTHLDYYLSLRTVGSLYETQGRLEEAEAAYAEMLGGFGDTLSPGHPDLGVGMTLHGRTLVKLGRLDEAEPVLLDAAARLTRAFAPNHRRVIEVREALVELYEARDDDDTAQTYRDRLPPGEG